MSPPQDGNLWGPEATPYEAIGGAQPVRDLVEAFYDRIDAESPDLREMLPRDDSGSRQKLFEFMSGWLGGPNLYAEKRGHPRLRMRHLSFSIGGDEAEEWMRCMRLAMDEVGVTGDLRAFMDTRLGELADHMRNQ
jgi:hemoglobin